MCVWGRDREGRQSCVLPDSDSSSLNSTGIHCLCHTLHIAFLWHEPCINQGATDRQLPSRGWYGEGGCRELQLEPPPTIITRCVLLSAIQAGWRPLMHPNMLKYSLTLTVIFCSLQAAASISTDILAPAEVMELHSFLFKVISKLFRLKGGSSQGP